MKRLTEQVNLVVRDTETNLDDWVFSELAQELYWWVDAFNLLFFREQPLGYPALSFDRTRVTSYGHFVIHRNAFGMKWNINLNALYLHRPMPEILSTLLHEMIHQWQQEYGRPSNSWYHNREFRQKALECGIICDAKGCHKGLTEPFTYIMWRFCVPGISMLKPAGDSLSVVLPPVKKPKGRSKLKKWECRCGQKARVGRKEFFAVCTLCGHPFELVE